MSWRIVGAGLALASAGAARAQEGDERLLLEEIPSVFGASKRPQALADAPAAVSIVTAEEIRRFGYQRLDEVLGGMRGLHTGYDLMYPSLGVRGFSRPGDENSRVLLLVDGHRVNSTIFGSAPLHRDMPVPLEEIEQIEIIRGPSSSLYGTSAVLAVINVVTRRGRDVQGAEVGGGGGAAATGFGRAAYGERSSGGWEVLVAGRGEGRGGEDVYLEAFDDPAGGGGIAAGLDGQADGQALAKLGYGDVSLVAAVGYRRRENPSAAWGTAFGAEGAWLSDLRNLVGVEASRALSERLTAQGRLQYDNYVYRGSYPYEDGAGILINRDAMHSDRAGAEGSLAWTLGRLGWLNVGSELQLGLREEQRNYDEATGDVYLDASTDYWTVGVYVQEELDLGPVTLNAGARHDRYPSFGGTTNPRLALIVRAGPSATFKALYGKAFRAPTAFEEHYTDGGYAFAPATATLDPERIETAELIYEQALGPAARGTIVGFGYRVSDLIDVAPAPGSELLAFQNLSSAEGIGAEAEVEASVGAWLGRASWSRQEVRDSATHHWMPDSPRNIGKLAVSAPLWGERLYVSPEARLIGERLAQDGSLAPAATTVNVTLHSPEFFVPGLRATATAANVLDADAVAVVSAELPQATIPQEGRSFRLQADYSF